MARARSQLSQKQAVYVDKIMEGKSRNASALAAGYPNSTAPELSETVRQEIALAREKLTDITQIKRVDIVDGILDGISCARMQGDAGNVIKGWVEVAKILGHAQPEVKTINVNINAQRLRSKYEALSDDELLAIQSGEVVDVEAKRLDH